MEKNTFMLFGLEYNTEFAYLDDNGLRFKKKEFEVKKGFTELMVEQQFGSNNGRFIIFTTFKALQKLKENSTCRVINNDKGIYIVETKDFRFINFNQVANVSRIEQVNEKYKIEGQGLVLMENFIEFLKELGVSNKVLATKWLTGIQREIFYSELSKEDLNFKDKRFNLMRSSSAEKRKFVYQYLKKSCEDSGILETTVGEFENVI